MTDDRNREHKASAVKVSALIIAIQALEITAHELGLRVTAHGLEQRQERLRLGGGWRRDQGGDGNAWRKAQMKNPATASAMTGFKGDVK